MLDIDMNTNALYYFLNLKLLTQQKYLKILSTTNFVYIDLI